MDDVRGDAKKEQIDTILESTLEFLEMTKDGKYAPVDYSIIERGRAEEETVLQDEIYIYNISA